MKFPYPAFMIRPSIANGFTDSAGAVLVWVQSINRKTGTAEIVARNGREPIRRQVAFSELASTPAAAAEKLATHLSALLSRPPQTAVAGKTESEAAVITA